MFRLLTVVALALIVMLPAAPLARQTPVTNPQTVAVDFIAAAASGAPVLDLKPEEIHIRIGSRERPVLALDAVRLAPPGAEAVPPPFASSIASRSTSRTLLIVLDDESMRPGREQPIRDAVAHLLSNLSPSDRVSIITLPLGGIRLDLTTDHVRAREVFSTLGGKAPRTESASDFACRTRRTLETLVSILRSVQAGESPVHVVFISSSLSGPTRDTTVRTATDQRMGPGMCELDVTKFEAVGSAAAEARATFHVIQPEDQMVQPGAVSAGDLAGGRIGGIAAGIESVAGVTGGSIMRLGDSPSDTTERLLRDTSTYYVATIARDASDRGVSRLDVTTTRPGVRIAARPRIALVPSDAWAGRKSQVTATDMLRQLRGYAEFGMRAIGYASSNPGDSRIRVIALAEVEPATKLTGAAIGMFDTGGKLVAQWSAREGELAGPQLMAALAVPPGSYRMRVAAVDASGRAATADYPIDARLASAGPIKMSGVVIGVSRAGSFLPRMIFSAEPTAIAQVEVLDVPEGTIPSARIEIAREPDGTAVTSVPGAFTPAPTPGRFNLTGVLPIGALAPGDYIVRVIVSSPNNPAGRVMRTIRKVAN